MLIDAVVHPLMRRNDVLQGYLKEPMRRLFAPGSLRSMYPAPTGAPPYGEFLEASRPADAGPLDLPGSDPEGTLVHLRAQGVERAILVPLTRGLNASTNHNTAICAATNDWLAETWLVDPLFLGSICVNPRDPEAAVAEIERWAGDGRMAQIVVPMLVHQPYGVRAYHPIWEAASAHGLPVAIRSDGGTGIEYPPTPVGYPRSFTEFATLASATFANHLASFIAEGAFDRFPDLRVVFTDGGHDLLTSMVWRLDTTIPACRGETPWVTGMPSDYIEPHVRFATARLERPTLDGAQLAEWMRISRGADLLLYGSHYPHWTCEAPADVFPELDGAIRRRLLGENAAAFYGARLGAGAGR